MSDDRAQTIAPSQDDAPTEAADPGRLRFSGIVERSTSDPILSAPTFSGGDDEVRWNALSRQVWQASRLTAIFVFASFILGTPLGNYLAHLNLYGAATGWNPIEAYEADVLIWAIVVPALVLLAGYVTSHAMTMVGAAQSIAAAAEQFTTPDQEALRNVDTVGGAVRGHVSALNEGLDGALKRLASVEAMIRQHVEAIELSGVAIEDKTSSAVGRVADERARLMELTESLNAHADSFAAAIAERANATIESIQSADTLSERAQADFDDRLSRLETAAGRAVGSFEALREALRDASDHLLSSTETVDDAATRTERATQRATAAANEAAESAARNAANVIASAERASDAAADAANAAIETADEASKIAVERASATAAEAIEQAQAAADEALGQAQEKAARITSDAIDQAKREAEKIHQAAEEALGEMSKTTGEAVDAAAKNAERASQAAAEVSEAAKTASAAAEKASSDVAEAALMTSDAADKAASQVAEASERARSSAEDAVKLSEAEAARIEERNRALAEARASLEKENTRLEALIDEQRKRADRLADAIASQTERLSRLAEAQLREQEAAARLAEAQNEMQARAEKQAADEERRAKEAREAEAQAEAARAAEAQAEAERLKAEQAEKERLERDRLERDRLERERVEAEVAAAAALAKKEAAEKAAAEARDREAARQAADSPQISLGLPEDAAPSKTPQSSAAKSANGAARLDALADDIAGRKSNRSDDDRRPIKLGRNEKDEAQPRAKSDVSWKEILDAADDAEPLELGADAKTNETPNEPEIDEDNAIKVISKLQNFTLSLETRLYGDPPPALQERFDRGDRNVFANRLLRLNETDIKRRIRSESARDREFEQQIHGFLQSFEGLLEEATTSDTADEELEEYLSSPLGRIYLLIGATVGYFA